MQAHVEPALRHLATIYEQQKDWDQAIDSRRRLEQVTGHSEQAVIAQYYCELAQAALESDEETSAKRDLKHAQSHDKDCVRAKLLAGDLACAAGDWKTGYRYYRDVLEIEVTFATEVLPPLVRTLHHSDNQTALDELLQHLCKRHKGAVNQIALAAILEPGLNSPIARECVSQYMRTAPGLRGVYDMFISFTGREDPQERNIVPVQIALRRLLENGPRYKCEQCGLTAKTLYWQCPSCKTWNSTKPFHDIGFGPVAIPASATAGC
jgi:lipopolysaccharide biosynthesis regulator YciM